MSCDHPPMYCVHDDREGTVVCTLCAHVIDQLYMFDNSLKEARDTSNENITNICINFNIADSIRHRCNVIFQRTCAISKSWKFPTNVLVAYSIYYGLLEHSISRSPQEIFCMTGVPLSQIFEVEKTLTPQVLVIPLSPVTYIERFAVQCGLNFKDTQNIIRSYKNVSCTSEHFDNYGPPTIAAAFIVLYCKEKKITFTIKNIAKICLVSASSIYRVVKKMKK